MELDVVHRNSVPVVFISEEFNLNVAEHITIIKHALNFHEKNNEMNLVCNVIAPFKTRNKIRTAN